MPRHDSSCAAAAGTGSCRPTWEAAAEAGERSLEAALPVIVAGRGGLLRPRRQAQAQWCGAAHSAQPCARCCHVCSILRVVKGKGEAQREDLRGGTRPAVGDARWELPRSVGVPPPPGRTHCSLTSSGTSTRLGRAAGSPSS